MTSQSSLSSPPETQSSFLLPDQMQLWTYSLNVSASFLVVTCFLLVVTSPSQPRYQGQLLKYIPVQGCSVCLLYVLNTHTPHAASSAQIFLSVVTHKANHIFRKDRNKVKTHFSMTPTGSTTPVKKLQATFGTVYAAIEKKNPKTQNPNVFPGCEQVVTSIAQRRSAQRASKLRCSELLLFHEARAHRGC